MLDLYNNGVTCIMNDFGGFEHFVIKAFNCILWTVMHGPNGRLCQWQDEGTCLLLMYNNRLHLLVHCLSFGCLP